MNYAMENISFSYDGNKVLDSISFSINEGRVIAIHGASGCGKTTLLRILSGFLMPDEGKLYNLNPKEISFLFQENRLFEGLTASEQISCVLKKGENVQKWLDAVCLSGYGMYHMGELSGGMQRRVALARCLAYGHDKKLLILDEPFTGVDTDTVKQIMDFMRRMGKTIIFTAHDAETLSLADEILDL